VEKFLHEVLNTKDFPLTVMDRPIESETTKIVENSYRAATLAYLNEWSLFAERNGVDLIKVIKAIKMRPTHSNMIFPGPGIGGYCLPKDGGLGYWAYRHILGFEDGDDIFQITPTAIDINDTRSLHVAELTRDALRNLSRYIAGSQVLVCGASYRQDVGDTRYSGSLKWEPRSAFMIHLLTTGTSWRRKILTRHRDCPGNDFSATRTT
jgi:UDP-N-acetyl-D-glucosamine dehydrogenase